MIATCPACDKRYRLADDAVPANGRTLRCAVCGHGWTVLPAEPEAAPPEAPLLQFDPPVAAAPVPPPPVPVASDDIVRPAADPDDPPPRRRWGLVALLVLAVLALSALAVVEFAPATTFDQPRLGLPAVAEVALPSLPPLDLTQVPLVGDRLDALVNRPPAPPSPLKIAASGERRRLGNGTWLLTVTGSVTNPTGEPVSLTGIDAALLDPAGHVALRWHIAAPASVIAPHASAAFESLTANFPPAATVLRLTVH